MADYWVVLALDHKILSLWSQASKKFINSIIIAKSLQVE